MFDSKHWYGFENQHKAERIPEAENPHLQDWLKSKLHAKPKRRDFDLHLLVIALATGAATLIVLLGLVDALR